MHVEPQKEHRWLEQLVGDWTYESIEAAAEGQEPKKHIGTERVRMIGDLWMIAEGEGETPGGGRASSLMTVGYDVDRKRFVGTWVGSMMAFLWVYDGELDATGKALMLNSTGPSMKGDGAMAEYQDVITIESPDYRTLTGRMKGDDGQWTAFMTVHYRRKPR